jgi:hypothetical protein
LFPDGSDGDSGVLARDAHLPLCERTSGDDSAFDAPPHCDAVLRKFFGEILRGSGDGKRGTHDLPQLHACGNWRRRLALTKKAVGFLKLGLADARGVRFLRQNM